MKINPHINLISKQNQSNLFTIPSTNKTFNYDPNQPMHQQRADYLISYFNSGICTVADFNQAPVKINNQNHISYFKTSTHYAVDENTHNNLTSKLDSNTLTYVLFKEGNLNTNTQSIDEKQIFKKIIDDMIIEQTDNILGRLGRHSSCIYCWGGDSWQVNYSYAYKFNSNHKSDDTYYSNYYLENFNYYQHAQNTPEAIFENYYLNSYANSNLINTKFGKAEIFLDLAGNNDKLGIGTLNKNAQLFRFDSDGNGFVDKNDMYFDKLKIRAYDKDGNEIIKKLGDVVDRIDLKDFIDSKENAIKKWDKQVSNYGWDEKTYNTSYEYISSYNPYSHFKAEIRYQSMNENDLKELAKLAGNDGWIDASKLKNLANLAYAKINFDGNYKLEELNYAKDQTSKNSDQYLKFKALYDDYMAELNALNGFFDSYKQVASDEIMAEFGDIINNPEFKSSKMLKIQSEFVAITGLKFSLENLQKVKDSFETDKKAAANMLIDTDSLTAIRINENGTFTLRFNSGREINVSKLYKDSGKAFNEALNVNADFMDEKELNEKIDLSVSMVKIKNENTGKLEEKSLKDLGVELIQKTTNGKLFILRTKEGKSIVVNQIYTKTQSEAQNSQNAQNAIDEKEKFYPKPLKIWA